MSRAAQPPGGRQPGRGLPRWSAAGQYEPGMVGQSAFGRGRRRVRRSTSPPALPSTLMAKVRILDLAAPHPLNPYDRVACVLYPAKSSDESAP